MIISTDLAKNQAGGNPAVGARSPFIRLRELLECACAGQPSGSDIIDLSIGEPRHPFPPVVADILKRQVAGFAKYPPARGTRSFRAAIGSWLDQRYQLGGRLDPETSILPLAGSREGLFLIAMIAADKARARGIEQPVFLLPNPFYQTYAAAVRSASGTAVYLAAARQNGYLPDLDATAPPVRDRLAAIYLCSPANPQGSVASRAYWQKTFDLARSCNAVVIADECYSEIYRNTPPTGVLEAADGDYSAILSFNSLSKRSNLPGLRAGFVAGDPELIAPFLAQRNIAAATVPLPVLSVAETVYGDEDHVTANRALYNAKFEAVAEILDGRFGHQTPPGAFFLWLNMSESGLADKGGDGHTIGESAALHLWRQAGVKVIPGAYLTMPTEGNSSGGSDPGADYIRIALVGDLEQTKTALTRLIQVFCVT